MDIHVILMEVKQQKKFKKLSKDGVTGTKMSTLHGWRSKVNNL